MHTSAKTVIIIAGPTAAGKTAAAIEVARHFGAEIISADSRQCYKELNIGVARPSAEELAAVPHHFIASHSIHDKVTAAVFEAYALQKAERLFQRRDVAVMVGGTGLYINAFCQGFDFIPEIPAAVREEIIVAYRQKGLTWLQATVQEADPEFYATGEVLNPQRLMRALEVKRFTGQTILRFRNTQRVQRRFRIMKLAVGLPKEALASNISYRVDEMMKRGLLEEVKPLLPQRHLPALQTVGYKELFDYLAGEDSLEKSIEKIKTATRRYAKRQLTWFRKDPDYVWLPPSGRNMIDYLRQQL